MKVDASDRKGLFIVLDGGEGVGKTTNSMFIKSYLKSRQIEFESTREPGGTEFAEKIRQLVLSETTEQIEPITELLLIFAARCQHLYQKILPSINRGEWVLCDRFTDATYAYQGGGRGIDQSIISLLEDLVQKAFRPDCVIILDTPLEVGRSRISERGYTDRLESESDEFHKKVMAVYRERAMANPEKYKCIDASKPLDDVQLDIAAVLDDLIRQWRVD